MAVPKIAGARYYQEIQGKAEVKVGCRIARVDPFREHERCRESSWKGQQFGHNTDDDRHGPASVVFEPRTRSHDDRRLARNRVASERFQFPLICQEIESYGRVDFMM